MKGKAGRLPREGESLDIATKVESWDIATEGASWDIATWKGKLLFTFHMQSRLGYWREVQSWDIACI